MGRIRYVSVTWRECLTIRPHWWVQRLDGTWKEVELVNRQRGYVNILYTDGTESGVLPPHYELPTLNAEEAETAGIAAGGV